MVSIQFWWFLSGVYLLQDLKWQETSGTLWLVCVSSFSLTSEHPALCDTEENNYCIRHLCIWWPTCTNPFDVLSHFMFYRDIKQSPFKSVENIYGVCFFLQFVHSYSCYIPKQTSVGWETDVWETGLCFLCIGGRKRSIYPTDKRVCGPSVQAWWPNVCACSASKPPRGTLRELNNGKNVFMNSKINFRFIACQLE